MRRSVFPSLVLSMALAWLLVSSAAAMTLSEIEQQLKESVAMRDPVMGFEQRAEIRGPLFTRWNFVNVVTRHHDRVEVEVGSGAPSWMPTEATTDLIDMKRTIERFDLELIGTETEAGSGKFTYVLQGARKAQYSTGAERIKLWVEPTHWTVVRADLEYSWGRMEVRQWYQWLGDRLVLERQEAKGELPLWVSVTLRIEYDAYWFDEP